MPSIITFASGDSTIHLSRVLLTTFSNGVATSPPVSPPLAAVSCSAWIETGPSTEVSVIGPPSKSNCATSEGENLGSSLRASVTLLANSLLTLASSSTSPDTTTSSSIDPSIHTPTSEATAHRRSVLATSVENGDAPPPVIEPALTVRLSAVSRWKLPSRVTGPPSKGYESVTNGGASLLDGNGDWLVSN